MLFLYNLNILGMVKENLPVHLTLTKFDLYKVETQKKILDTRVRTLFVGWGEGLDLCELENAPEMQKCPKTFVHDCRPYYGICPLFVVSAPVKPCI